MSNALEVKNISKIYKSYSSNLARVASWFGLASKKYSQTQVLYDVDFSVKHGETIGIIGQNGAGKSTLLKIITGTLKASGGSIKTTGAICSILELGMGFHPDLSGEENVYHTAGLMGHSKEQIAEKLEYIKSFADIGEYFYEPVRLYSSGMQVRLAFAIVTAWQPSILIIDEALSVGDAYFQHKSFARIKELKDAGTTLLLVSHDLPAIASICSRAILLDKGKILKDDEPSAVIDYYNALISQKEGVSIEQSSNENGAITISGTGAAQILDVYICNENGQKAELFNTGDDAYLHILIRSNEDIDDLTIGFLIKDRLGLKIYGTNTYYLGKSINTKSKKHYEVKIKLELILGVGSYAATVALHSGHCHVDNNYAWKDNATIFEIANTKYPHFDGYAFLNSKIADIKEIDG